jgi:GNAT superfamily N-acetyltransferase
MSGIRHDVAAPLAARDAIAIRPARLEDLPTLVTMRDALNALEREGCPHAPIQRLSLDEFTALWGGTLYDRQHCWRIVEQLGKPIGFALVYLLPKSRPLGAFLHWAYLQPEQRRQGLGRVLLDHLVEWMRGQGAVRIELQFIEGNEGARQFWTKVGFRPYAQRCVCYVEPGLANR